MRTPALKTLVCLKLLAGTLSGASLTLTAVGDVRITPRLIHGYGEQLQALRLRGDMVLANFEGTLSDRPDPDPNPDPKHDQWKFGMPGVAVEILERMGINTLNLANNHSMDMGSSAYQNTVETLGAHFAVAGREGREAVATIRGQHVRVIGFSFGTVNDVNRLDAIPRAIGLKRREEVVVVSAHMGGESRLSHQIPYALEFFEREPRGDVVAFSHRCIDAGADLVLGHGPHVPRGMELYKNKLIVYSLGNFLFDYPGASLHPHTPGYAITVELDPRGDFESAQVASYDLRGGVPVEDPSGEAYRIIRYLSSNNVRQSHLEFPGKGRIRKCGR